MKTSAIYLLAMILAAPLHAEDAEKPTVTWLTAEFEPAWIVDGPDKGKGFEDIHMQFFIERLPEYNHDIVIANLMRLERSLKAKDRIIGGTGHAGPPWRYGPGMLMSELTFYTPSSGVVVRKADLAKFKHGKNLSLEKDLLGNSNIRAGVYSGNLTNFHKDFDKLVQQNIDNVDLVPTLNQERFFRLLVAKNRRFDYFFTYPFSYKWNVKKFDLENEVAYLPYMEVEYDTVYAYFTQTPESKVLLDKVNKLIRSPEYKLTVVGAMLDYLPDNVRDQAAAKNGLRYVDGVLALVEDELED